MNATVVTVDQTRKAVGAHLYKGWFPVGESPTVEVSASRKDVNLLGAITGCGETTVQECGGSFTGDVTIRFPQHLQTGFGENLVVTGDRRSVTLFLARAYASGMDSDKDELQWELHTKGTLEQIKNALPERRGAVPHAETVEGADRTGGFRITGPKFDYSFRSPSGPPVASIYDYSDLSPFAPSGATYFMDGFSEATFQIYDSGEKITLEFWDKNTSISASAPFVFDEDTVTEGVYLPVPEPLSPFAYVPRNTPNRYTRKTSTHLMQVISMNMRENESTSRLLIGLPYAEEYPELFFNRELFEGEVNDGSSYGVVQSLTEFEDPITGEPEVDSNGYPARSFFAIYHLLETPVGTFFNKKATQMELQPSRDGKLALKLPPIPFYYSLINGPIPLYSVDEPEGDPIGELVAAAHHAEGPATEPTDEAWPWHQPDLESIEDVISELREG